MTQNIDQSLADWKGLRDRLKARFPDLDDADLVDTLDGATDLREAVVELLNRAIEDEALIVGLDDMMTRLKLRRERLTARVERIRGTALAAMEESGLRKIEAPAFTASVGRKPQAVVITDDTAIPDEFWRWKPSLDKAAIRAALKDGQHIAGAALGNGGTNLVLRRG